VITLSMKQIKSSLIKRQ